MSLNTIRRKLKFPGMLEKQVIVLRERLLTADNAAKTMAFRKFADRVLPRWDGK